MTLCLLQMTAIQFFPNKLLKKKNIIAPQTEEKVLCYWRLKFNLSSHRLFPLSNICNKLWKKIQVLKQHLIIQYHSLLFISLYICVSNVDGTSKCKNSFQKVGKVQVDMIISEMDTSFTRDLHVYDKIMLNIPSSIQR